MLTQLYKPFQHWSENGAVWLYSDPHFNADEDIKANIKSRPSADEQVKMINAKVGKKDTIIFLGDIGDIEYVKQVRGYKVLICGNHDKGGSIYEEVFDEVYIEQLTIGPKIILSHEPIDGIDWSFNIHGHVHTKTSIKKCHLCVCSDVIGYTPISLNQFVKSGRLSEVKSIHRSTIDTATERKAKRERKTN